MNDSMINTMTNSMNNSVVSPEVQQALEPFYYCEARLLDSRQYQQWLALLCLDIEYLMPARSNPPVDNRQSGTEAMISVERELEGSDSVACPLREEGYVHLMLRAERAFKKNSWSENPPARTRRMVANVEVLAHDVDAGRSEVYSNFLLYYSRHDSENFIYSGQRRDILRITDEGYRIARREVITDFHVIAAPTMGLLF